MAQGARSRRAHLETVLEFDMVADAPSGGSAGAGERAVHGRHLVALTGAVVALGVAAVLGAGLDASPAPAADPVRSRPLVHSVTSCRPVATTPVAPGEPHLRCATPVPGTPSAEVAMRAARDAAVAQARARAYHRGPGTGTDRRWSADQP